MALAQLINPSPIIYALPQRSVGPLPSSPSGAGHDAMDVDGVAAAVRGADDGLVTASEVFDYVRDIKDPEHPYSLEQLKVVEAHKVWVHDRHDDVCFIRIEFTPTVPHCSLATLIGLCLRRKLGSVITKPFKLDINVTPGKHSTEAEINKQVNDKERVAAALENPNLLSIVRQCIGEAS